MSTLRGRPGLLSATQDPGNPPNPEEAKTLLADIAQQLGADPDQPDEVRQALDVLIEAAGADGTDGSNDPPRGFAGPVAAIDPKMVDAGRKALGWPAAKQPKAKVTTPPVRNSIEDDTREAARRIALREASTSPDADTREAARRIAFRESEKG